MNTFLRKFPGECGCLVFFSLETEEAFKLIFKKKSASTTCNGILEAAKSMLMKRNGFIRTLTVTEVGHTVQSGSHESSWNAIRNRQKHVLTKY